MQPHRLERVRGIGLESRDVVRLGLLEMAEVEVRAAAVLDRDGQARLELEGAVVALHGPRVVAGGLVGEAAVVEDAGRVGLPGERAVELGQGARVVAVPPVRDAALDVGVDRGRVVVSGGGP